MPSLLRLVVDSVINEWDGGKMEKIFCHVMQNVCLVLDLHILLLLNLGDIEEVKFIAKMFLEYDKESSRCPYTDPRKTRK